jgi:hypothetical protein
LVIFMAELNVGAVGNPWATRGQRGQRTPPY